MDKATVMALARQAEGEEQQHGMWRMHVEDLQRFANLIRDHITWSDIHSCHPGCTKPPCVAMRQAVLAEREACAVIAETPVYGEQDDITMEAKDRVAAAIRNRT